MPYIIILTAGLWWMFGDPKGAVADWFWPDEAAPWETVDAYYYPDRTDLTRHIATPGFSSVSKCQTWVHAEAAHRGDAGLTRGDYECGIGQAPSQYGLNVYRATVR